MENYINNAGLELRIIDRKGKQCTVEFIATGSIRKANIYNIRKGKVRDLYAPSRYGIGYDGEYTKNSYWKQAKQLWSNMLKRCYCAKDTKGYYGRATVDPRWHCFANFLSDISSLDGFNNWVTKSGYELDKDKFSDTKVYSKYTCQFITAHDNRSLQPNYRLNKIFCKETRSWINA